MLTLRTKTILKSIVGQYISRATPVPSQSIINDRDLRVSPATIRNEMALLEHEGYIARPHPSAGSIPLDKGYRYYVESLGDVQLPLSEQRLISHLFHQVEKELEDWLNLAATLIARLVQNVAIVSRPKAPACQFKHLEMVSLQEFIALVIIVFNGANVRQQLVTLDQIMSQAELAAIASKLSAAYSGLTRSQILAKEIKLSASEQQITDCLVKVMAYEDELEHEEQYLDGLHFMLNQPEFVHNQKMLSIMEMAEQRSLLRSIAPPEMADDRVRVIIGKENKTEVIHDYSVVIRRYGSEEAAGTIGVIGPTRMPYARTIATVEYLASVLNELAAKLYGRESPGPNPEATAAKDE